MESKKDEKQGCQVCCAERFCSEGWRLYSDWVAASKMYGAMLTHDTYHILTRAYTLYERHRKGEA